MVEGWLSFISRRPAAACGVCPPSFILAARFVYSCTVARLGISASTVAIAIAGRIELKDDGVVHQAVDGGSRGHRLLEDAFPFAEDQIAGDHHRVPLVTLSDQREQHLGFFGALFDVPDVIQDRQLRAIEPAQQARQRQVTLGGKQFLDELISRTEQHCMALLDKRVPECAGGVTLTDPWWAERQQVGRILEEFTACHFAQLAHQCWLKTPSSSVSK